MKHMLVIICSAWTWVLYGQSPYAKILEHPGNPLYARIYDAQVADNGKIVILGGSELGSTVAVFDTSAAFIWGKRLAPASVDQGFIPLQVRWMPGHDILLSGYSQHLPNGRSYAVMRLDSSGAVIWTQRFNLEGDTLIGGDARSIGLANGDIAFISLNGNKLILSRFDGTGQHLWSMSFPDVWVDELSRLALAECGNGDLLVRYASTVIRVSASGSLVFGFIYDIPGSVTWQTQVYFPNIYVLSDGGFVLQDIVDYYPSLIRFDANGAAVWAKKYDYGDYYQPWFTDMIELSGGDILAFPMSNWNRVIGMRVDQAGAPISCVGVGNDFRLWPGSSSYWPQPYIGRWNGLNHFIGTVQQLYNGGFTPELTGLFRLADDLEMPCGSGSSTINAINIVPLPLQITMNTIQTATCQQWTFPFDLHDIAYNTVEACPLILTVEEATTEPRFSVYPTVLAQGEAIAVRTDQAVPSIWELFDMNGRKVEEGGFNGAVGEHFFIPSTWHSGVYVLKVFDREGGMLGRAMLLEP